MGTDRSVPHCPGGALRLGTVIVVIVFAGMLALLLAPPVTWMVKHRIPATLASALVVFALVGSVGFAVKMLATPAISWLERAPQTVAQAERKIKRLTRPLEKLQATADKMEQVASGNGPDARNREVTVAPAGLFQRLSGTTTAMLGAILTAVFLTFFLLSTGGKFREKSADICLIHVRGQRPPALFVRCRSRFGYIFPAIINTVSLLTYVVLDCLTTPTQACGRLQPGYSTSSPTSVPW